MKHLKFSRDEEKIFANLYTGFCESGFSKGKQAIRRSLKVIDAMEKLMSINEPTKNGERKIELNFEDGADSVTLALEDAEFDLLKSSMDEIQWKRNPEALRIADALYSKIESAQEEEKL